MHSNNEDNKPSNNKHNSNDKSQKKDQVSPLNSYAVYSSVAIQMVAIIGIGTFAGIKIDEKYGNGGKIWTLILSLASVCLALFFVIRRILAASKDK